MAFNLYEVVGSMFFKVSLNDGDKFSDFLYNNLTRNYGIKTLFPPSGERVVKRSDDRVSQNSSSLNLIFAFIK